MSGQQAEQQLSKRRALLRRTSHRANAAERQEVGQDVDGEEAALVPAEESRVRDGQENRHAQQAAGALPVHDAHELDQGRKNAELHDRQDYARQAQHLKNGGSDRARKKGVNKHGETKVYSQPWCTGMTSPSWQIKRKLRGSALLPSSRLTVIQTPSSNAPVGGRHHASSFFVSTPYLSDLLCAPAQAPNVGRAEGEKRVRFLKPDRTHLTVVGGKNQSSSLSTTRPACFGT